MHKLEKLRDMLCEELEKVSKKEQVNTSDLEIIDKLAHSIKNLDKIIDEMSYGRSYGSYDSYDSYGRSRDYSYARRGRDGDGDGRYREGRSRDTHEYSRRMSNRFRDMMDETSNDRERDAIRRCIEELERS